MVLNIYCVAVQGRTGAYLFLSTARCCVVDSIRAVVSQRPTTPRLFMSKMRRVLSDLPPALCLCGLVLAVCSLFGSAAALDLTGESPPAFDGGPPRHHAQEQSHDVSETRQLSASTKLHRNPLLFVLGIFCHVLGCIGTALGLVLQKAAHVHMEGTGDDIPYWKSRKWLFGISVFLSAQILTGLAFMFAAQSALAPLLPVTLIANNFFASTILHEEVGCFGFVGWRCWASML